ncbi:MAG: peptide-methionine (S)-S-oxide reductase MsrA [Dehalococcoides mccartyi]|uniref:peptide-methionine (S)-S-oxide reductase MsrA n=1 Tax=Dehalococcoides mccartyi TaxID=61435 RepID=UPI0025CA5DA3|nr:peptide-methionine (S)-S-oxide reductase MsrA [Dehalococcoides mccartyi]MDN4186635.1 peptide-methionine (S)-S-oxide reductase MsrA [Dehalococcoides mccartyi]
MTETAVFGGGCFWCMEAVFSRLSGVLKVEPGYAGGTLPNPTYQQVCAGDTGHAEVVKLEFDPALVSYTDLLDIFFQMHDPTTPNRQGQDIGTQYRSVIFYTTPAQKVQAEETIKKLDESAGFPGRIVTGVLPLAKFYPAEDYHRQYYASHSRQPYCRFVIQPKLDKLKEHFGGMQK